MTTSKDLSELSDHVVRLLELGEYFGSPSKKDVDGTTAAEEGRQAAEELFQLVRLLDPELSGMFELRRLELAELEVDGAS